MEQRKLRSSNSVALKAYAKINLGLRVIGRRRDGFHELRTIYQTISLADHLEVRLAAGPPAVSLETAGIEVPPGRQNLAVRAAEAVLQELNLRRKVTVFLRKRIPSGSGLGGSSSDAAAVIRAVLHLAGKKMPADRLLALAARLGSDVPFFFLGGRALGIGRGEEVYPLQEEPRRYCVLLYPGRSMDTATAFRRLRAPLLTSPSTRHTIELFCGSVGKGICPRLGNDFEPVVFSAFRGLAAVKRSLLRSGAVMASLTGSGSVVFGVFEDYSQAQTAARRLRRPGADVFVARTVSRRELQDPLPGIVTAK